MRAIKATYGKISFSFCSRMLLSTLFGIFLVSTRVWSDNLSGTCGCVVETVESFNAQRIPSRMTEMYCQTVGATCGARHYSKVGWILIWILSLQNCFLKCYQLTGRLDVGYTKTIEDKEMVVHRRNVTIGIGCVCKPLKIQRIQQSEHSTGPFAGYLNQHWKKELYRRRHFVVDFGSFLFYSSLLFIK